MEQSLEQSVKTLVAHLELSERRYQQEKKRSRWLGIALVLSLIVSLTTVMFNISMVDEVQAVDAGVSQQMQQSMPPGMEELIKEMTIFLKALNAPETQQAMGNVVTFINSEQTHKAFSAMTNLAGHIEMKKLAEAMGLIDDIIIKTNGVLQDGQIADGINDLFGIIQGISRDMRVMAVDMHRMSNAATPAMGEMYDIMRFVPTPR